MFRAWPTPLRDLSGATPGLTSSDKSLDWQGGQFPTVNCRDLVAADFVTFPEDVPGGASCSNCEHNYKGFCGFKGEVNGVPADLRGQRVTSRNCCSSWNAPGTLRLGRGGCKETKALSAYNLTTGGALAGAAYEPDAAPGRSILDHPRRRVALPVVKPHFKAVERAKDKLGHEFCYDDDKGAFARVPCGGAEEESAPKPPGRHGQAVSQPGASGPAVSQPGASGPAVSQPSASGPSAGNSPTKHGDHLKQELTKLGRLTWGRLKQIGAAAAGYEHAAKEWVEHKLSDNLRKLEPDTQALVRGVWLAVRLGTKVAFATYTSGQKLAEMVAEERGAGAEAAARLRSIVSAVDVAAYKPVMIGVSGLAGPAAGVGASFVPVGSLTYLAYSTAVAPQAVLRAARRVVGLGGGRKALAAAGTDVAALLGEILAFVGDDDGRMAVVLVALDKTQDIKAAVSLARTAYQAAGRLKTSPDDHGLGRKNKALCKPGQTVEETHCTQVPPGQGQDTPGQSSPHLPPGKHRAAAQAPASGPHAGVAGGPSLPAERGHGNPPPKLMFKPPPPPGGQVGRGRPGGFTATVVTNGSLGDAMEELIVGLGFRQLTPLNGGRKVRGNPLDLEWDHSGYAFDLKVCTTEALEYRATPRHAEMSRKKEYAEQYGLEPGVIIAVTDLGKGEAHFYWRVGVGAYHLDPDDGGRFWSFLGTAKVKQSEKG